VVDLLQENIRRLVLVVHSYSFSCSTAIAERIESITPSIHSSLEFNHKAQLNSIPFNSK
jgi:hypothetical protein